MFQDLEERLGVGVDVVARSALKPSDERIRAVSAAVRAAVAQLDGVEVVQADETQVSLSVSDASHRLPAIFSAVNSAGEVRGTTLTQPSLESLFIKLTGKELRE